MSENTYDFSGYATKIGIKCSDGRTILKDAFKHQDRQRVPLVWQHLHNSPDNILGHADLESREDGVYCYGKFNDTEAGQNAKELVVHGDISNLSIYANQLQEKSKNVMHGMIREVSLVLSGANPGAKIEHISFAHSDGSVTEEDSEAIIYNDDAARITLQHADERTVKDVFDTLNEEQKTVVYALIAEALSGDETDGPDSEPQVKHADGERTVKDVFDTLNEEQKTVVYAMIAQALEEDSDMEHTDYEGDASMKTNVFDQQTNTTKANTLSHDQLSEIVTDAKRYGSLKESFIAHAEEYGFDPIDILFPDARAMNTNGPDLVKRDDTWVNIVLNEATHTPFARIKTMTADITADEARAKGYVTGNLKKDEIIPLM